VNDGRWETSCQTATCIRPGTGIRRSEAEAIAAWNTRLAPHNTEADALREALAAFLICVSDLPKDSFARKAFSHVENMALAALKQEPKDARP